MTTEEFFNLCKALIGNKITVTDQEINGAIDQLSVLYPECDRDLIVARLHAYYNVRIDEPQILEGRERRRPWLMAYKESGRSWPFWERYKEYQRQNLPQPVINKLDSLTDTILDKLFNPREDVVISKAGLVVGQVQSGKTSNYTGLICKAADAGFNIIIVLAGIHKNLRSQTQTRLDEGFLGFDTQYERAFKANSNNKIGVGNIPGELYKRAIANSYTSSHTNGDFTQRGVAGAGINFRTNEPLLFVIKKNATVLNRLNEWLEVQSETERREKALLLIDDEADNASINIKPDDDSTIHRNIVEILRKFRKTAYVGYTATPFANIFIPPDDAIFPRDFIINLPAPSNYIGPEKVFGTTSTVNTEEDDTLPVVCKINDYQQFVPTNHKAGDPMPTELPESLKTAIKCFILTCAIRNARGQGKKHNSMLVHVSRFNAWQECIHTLVKEQFEYYKTEIEAGDPTIMEEMRHLFEDDDDMITSYRTTTAIIMKSGYKDEEIKEHKWEDIRPILARAVGKIQVKKINGTSADSLSYYDHQDTGISVIAIGGDKLSRGLTLEGLSISYFLRASKMYDTLMQMGRWFGYRPGYVDLCRLFLSPELDEWYRHITLASEELRDEFTYLFESGGTPEDYALKVRNHPGVLQITSAAKMQNVTELQVSWAGRLIESYQLCKDLGIKHRNLVATADFINNIDSNHSREDTGCGLLWRDIDVNAVLELFGNLTLPPSLKKVDLEMISQFIREANRFNELNLWNIALMSREGNLEGSYAFSDEISANCFRRTCSQESTESIYHLRKNHILGGPTDEFVDLDRATLEKALMRSQFIARSKDQEWDKNYPKPMVVRQEYRDVKHPLLLLYLLNPQYAKVSLEEQFSEEPFVGFAIAFPHSNSGIAVSYTVNQIGDFAVTEQTFEDNNDNQYEEE